MYPPPLRYAISNWNQAGKPAPLSPIEQAKRLAHEGVEFYQLREKNLPAGELGELARGILHAIEGTQTKLLLNGRADIAAAVGAHGVHLPSSTDELHPADVIKVYAAADRPSPVVTASCHSIDDIHRLLRDPPTAILFGPVFSKTVDGKRVQEGTGLALLQQACALAASLPVFALGGVTDENTAPCLKAGAAGIASIRLFQRIKR